MRIVVLGHRYQSFSGQLMDDGGGPDQLCRDAKSITRSSNRTFHYVRDTELHSNLGNRYVLTLEGKCRRASRKQQFRQPRQ